MIKNPLFFLLAAVCFFGCCRFSPAPVFRSDFMAMGTIVEIKVYEPGFDKQYVISAVQAAEAEIRRIDRLLSLYDEHSDIYRVNSHGFEQWVSVSPETIEILEYAKLLCEKTGGALDVAAGNLFELWGFGIKRGMEIPPESKISENLRAAGFKNVIIDKKNGRIRLKNSLVRIDLGSIAKGYAVDAAAKKMEEHNLLNVLVNAGGDIYCGGTNGKQAGWLIGVRNPRKTGESAAAAIIRDKAIVTSGDYENFFLREGKRYSHIIDPRTGRPVSNNVISVTIIGPDARTADALATAVMVAGVEEGMKIVERAGSECYIIVEDRNGLSEKKSKGFNVFSDYMPDVKHECETPS
ncbi:MAG: FAD:protein FMN transferase [Candidatus Aureabacteria bacterium]|nr:FAD:protein FMN transferase [Candidatus Auribacterota bacterium]